MLKISVFRFFLILAALFYSMTASGAETICAGVSQVSVLKKYDTSAWEKIRAKADATINGNARFWKIEKPGLKTSYLLGTIHVTDPSVNDLPEEINSTLDQVDTVIIETTDVLDPQKAAKALAATSDLTMFTDGTTLLSLVPPQDHETVKVGLKARGIPLVSVQKMKPWLLNSVLAVPACEQRRKAEGNLVLDFRIAREAKDRGLNLDGLETIGEQFEAFMSVSLDDHVSLMVSSLRHQDKVDDALATMIALYLDSDIGAIQPFAEHIIPQDGAGDKMSAMEQHVIIDRNHTMAQRSIRKLETGAALIAVGALHLPGDEGIVQLLIQQGFTLTPIL